MLTCEEIILKKAHIYLTLKQKGIHCLFVFFKLSDIRVFSPFEGYSRANFQPVKLRHIPLCSVFVSI